MSFYLFIVITNIILHFFLGHNPKNIRTKLLPMSYYHLRIKECIYTNTQFRNVNLLCRCFLFLRRKNKSITVCFESTLRSIISCLFFLPFSWINLIYVRVERQTRSLFSESISYMSARDKDTNSLITGYKPWYLEMFINLVS